MSNFRSDTYIIISFTRKCIHILIHSNPIITSNARIRLTSMNISNTMNIKLFNIIKYVNIKI